MNFHLSEVGGENGAKRSPPTGNPSPAPTHPHRTHDTTDQWREVVQWLGRFWRKVLLSGRRPRPTSIGFKHVFVDLSKEKQWFRCGHGNLMDQNVNKT